jgi:hypothetical protein
MPPSSNSPTGKSLLEATSEQFFDFLTPEQRLSAVAEILGSIALRIVQEEHEAHPETLS